MKHEESDFDMIAGLLFSGNAFAVTVEFESLNHNINYFVKKGYKITFVNHHTGWDQMYYTLEKDDDVILCRVKQLGTECWKP